MKDDLRAVDGEDFVEGGCVSGGGEDGRVRRGEVAIDCVEVLLGCFEKQDLHGVSRCDSMREGGADGASGSGDEDALTADKIVGNGEASERGRSGETVPGALDDRIRGVIHGFDCSGFSLL